PPRHDIAGDAAGRMGAAEADLSADPIDQGAGDLAAVSDRCRVEPKNANVIPALQQDRFGGAGADPDHQLRVAAGEVYAPVRPDRATHEEVGAAARRPR